MAELTLYSRPVRTVFDLLGSKEDDITYSVGWGLGQSEAFTRAVLAEAFGEVEQGEITAIRLQESAPGTGRTDAEIATATASRNHAEKRLLVELTSYLKGLMTMQDVTSNMVFVVVLGQDPLKWSSLTFKDTVIGRGFYYHPVGGKGWPHTPPNYIGFRFDGRLQQVRHIDRYEVITRPHDHIPEIIPQANWSDEPHFLYTLGPPIEPAKPVLNGKIWPNARLWCALDLLLTCDTISEARDKTQERLASTGQAAA